MWSPHGAWRDHIPITEYVKLDDESKRIRKGDVNRTTRSRCRWAGNDPLMQAYHDEEWGLPQRDPRALWEMLTLEGFQAGLSWAVVLRKREAFQRAFKGFEPEAVARFTTRDFERLLANPAIIRSRAKIEAAVAGAKIYCEMRDRGEDFADYSWAFTAGRVVTGDGRSVPVQTPLSDTISRDLKRRGFKFVGPTIVYSWMQAVGIVNDHSLECFRRGQVARTSRSRNRS
jgi:DNA-3-methyladenine glycosylase I